MEPEGPVPGDIRGTDRYREAEEHFRQALEPGFGTITTAADPQAAPDGSRIAFTGTKLERLEGKPLSRICTVPAAGGEVREITGGPNNDRSARWSPAGDRLAFLSDRAKRGQFALYLLDSGPGEARATPPVEGSVETLAWSPDPEGPEPGERILLVVAGPGAERSAVEGSGSMGASEERPAWMPAVDVAPSERDMRRAYIHDLRTGQTRPLTPSTFTVWEADWAGPNRLIAIVSSQPTEDAWYDASLALLDAHTGEAQSLYKGNAQLGHPTGSPDGRHLAVVEATSSDRGVVAGDLLLLDPDGTVQRIDTHGVDVTDLAWRDGTLLYAGVRRQSSVIGELDVASGAVRELWNHPGASNGFYPQVSPSGRSGVLTVADLYNRYPEIVLIEDGEERTVTSLAHPGAGYLMGLGGTMEEVQWTASDGWTIEGLLLRPEGAGPFPLIVSVHGGPVGSTRNAWSGPGFLRSLVSRGYAFLFPNPRGSSGWGQEFAGAVMGDVGGAETGDILSGVDAMVERGIADPNRLGVIGASHGGFMSAWLVTQTDRFAAAVPMHPISDWYSQRGTSNISRFDELFLADDAESAGGRYGERSPVLHASKVRTPTLLVAGGDDRCTPPGQAREFHQALLRNGVESVLVTYPGEGHGVRGLPARIDQTARIVEWFERHLPV